MTMPSIIIWKVWDFITIAMWIQEGFGCNTVTHFIVSPEETWTDTDCMSHLADTRTGFPI